MAQTSFNFTAVGVGSSQQFLARDKFSYSVSGTFVGTVILEESTDGGASWKQIGAPITSPKSSVLTVNYGGSSSGIIRFQCLAYTSGTIETVLSDVDIEISAVKDNRGVEIIKVTEAGAEITGQLDMNANKIINVAAATDAQDVVTKDYVDAIDTGANSTLSNLSSPTTVNQTLNIYDPSDALFANESMFLTTVNNVTDPGYPYFQIGVLSQNSATVDYTMNASFGAQNVDTGGTATVSTGELFFRAGDVRNSGTAGATGGVTLLSGRVRQTGIITGTTGSVQVSSGRIESNAQGAGTGNVTLESGAVQNSGISATTGDVFVSSGSNSGSGGETGQVRGSSGSITNASNPDSTGVFAFDTGSNSGLGETGGVSFASGFIDNVGNSAQTGNINFDTGAHDGSGNSGGIFLNTGNVDTGNSGDINLTTGTSNGTRGSVNIDALHMSMSNSKIVDVADPTNAQDVATKNYVDSASSGMATDFSNSVASTKNIDMGGFGFVNTSGAQGSSIILSSNPTVGSSSGTAQLVSGQVTGAGANSGTVTIGSGNSTGNSGQVIIQSGVASANAGAIRLQPGSTSAEITFYPANVWKFNGTGIMTVNTNMTLNVSGRINASGSTGPLRLPNLAADPVSPANGDMWYNTTTNKLRAHVNGVSVDIA